MKFTDAVSAPVLETLTTGIYDGNANCVREYVQNAGDSGSKKIEVLTQNGNTVIIRDYGSGMDEEELFNALHLGKSSKSGRQAGWRGIGIYSGISNFEKIFINTKKNGADKLHVEIDCGKMRENYGKATSINQILEDSISKEIEQTQDPSFEDGTQVILSGVLINQAFFFQDNQLEQYLTEAVPLPLTDNDFSNKIISGLFERGVEEPPFELCFNGKKLYREPRDPDLFLKESLTFHDFKKGDKLVAVAWYVLNKENRQLKEPLKGLAFKKKGFTIGDANTVRRLYLKTYSFWSYGEIHIVDSEIKENSGRNNLEINSGHTAWLLESIGDFLGKLQQIHRYKSSFYRASNVKEAKEEITNRDYRSADKALKDAVRSMQSGPKPPSDPAFKNMTNVISQESEKQKSEIRQLAKTINDKKQDEEEGRITDILAPLEDKDRRDVRKKLADTKNTHEMFNHPMKDLIDSIRTKTRLNTTEPRKLLRETFHTSFSDDPGEVKKNAKLLLVKPERIFDDLTKVEPVELKYPYYITAGLGQTVYELYNIVVNGEKHYSGGLLSLLLAGQSDETRAKAYRDMYFTIEFLKILVDLSEKNGKGSS